MTVLQPVNLLGEVAWRAAVRLGGRTRPTATLVRLHDRIVVPVVRISERWVAPPFGQSVLCVVTAPARSPEATCYRAHGRTGAQV